MAELAAIGLASNILQFLELGIKLFSKARSKYKSISGFTEDDEELITHTERLQTLARLIHDEDDFNDFTQFIDADLFKIARSCNRTATALIETLNRLGVGTGRNRRWESFRKALYQELKKAEIEKMEERLRKLRESLILHLTDAVSKLVLRLDQFAAETKHVQKQQRILSSLFFPKIKQRYIAIQKHHRATFQWIFTENKTSFCEWLETGDGLFWVKGKAGSGKSTLMKFLAAHSATQTKLQVWAANQRVITASHFFWNAGNSMQKSLTGLLQTLLYQVLKECPELIEVVCPSRWTTMFESAHAETWDETELLSAFEKLSCQKSLPARFCFFIDGLDEYTAGEKRYKGTFSELIDPLKTLVSSDSIKICVSSRPWNAFNDSFSQVKWQLQLEDVTKDDIRAYVEDELKDNTRFQELAQRDSRCTQIPDTIVERARGVFLWVYLVVLSLQRGLSEEDNYLDLQQRLNQLPDDLEDYFRHILQSIEQVYWDQSARIFRVVIDAEQSLPLLGFEFFDQEMNDPAYAIHMKAQPMPSEDIHATCERLKKRLNARCRDLLSVTDITEEVGMFRFQVDFLHRTVRDFFLDTGVMEEITKQRATRNFNSHLSLCKIMLALGKVMPIEQSDPRVYNHIFTFADSLMYYAQQLEESYEQNYETQQKSSVLETFEILDELDRSNSERLRSLSFHWANLKNPPKGSFQEYRQKTFLASAIQARLSLYVESQLRQNMSQIQAKRGRPLLDYALRPTMVTPLKMSSQEQGPVLPIVRLLLDFGADPNHSIYIYDGKTIWELFLRACYHHARNDHDSDDVVKDIGIAIQLMLSHGAKMDCSIKLDDDTKVGIIEIVDKLGLSVHQVGKIKELLERTESGRSLFSSITSWWF
ncbi:hypothetical protein BGZ63DRAFT_435209 [Mariannaea sp. PMI_226]|nr:hypothetical protein BGZ63DRAFT_435209 [Mariannaea sp. PMI_226]